MSEAGAAGGAEAFFLDVEGEQRFCLFHPPGGACRGAVLYVHPFAEEMNKTRRMAAMQARELAAMGFGVLQIDLHGCGDSSGDFGDARWSIWKSDLALAHNWLLKRLERPITLWGLRLGALLATDYAASAAEPVAALVLWQPVLNGKTFMTQFLRLRVASDMIGEGKEGGGTQALRASLQAGATLEIAGYCLAPELVAAIDALDLAALTPPTVPAHWFEAVSATDCPLPPAAARVTDAWQKANGAVRVHAVPCPPFWAAQEITESPALLAATRTVFSGGAL